MFLAHLCEAVENKSASGETPDVREIRMKEVCKEKMQETIVVKEFRMKDVCKEKMESIKQRCTQEIRKLVGFCVYVRMHVMCICMHV